MHENNLKKVSNANFCKHPVRSVFKWHTTHVWYAKSINETRMCSKVIMNPLLSALQLNSVFKFWTTSLMHSIFWGMYELQPNPKHKKLIISSIMEYSPELFSSKSWGEKYLKGLSSIMESTTQCQSAIVPSKNPSHVWVSTAQNF